MTTTAIVDVEIVIPVFNEELDLERSVRRLHTYLHAQFPFGEVAAFDGVE